MKKVSILLLLIVLAFSCREKSNHQAARIIPAPKANATFYKLNQEVFVHALEGLSLRKTPDSKAEKIGIAPYGAILTIVAMPQPEHEYVAEKIGDFELKGHWVKVRNEEKQEAYVFDGYLTHFPILVEQMKEDLADPEWFYQDISKFKGEREVSAPNEAKGIVEGYKQAYADGGEFEYILYNGGVTQFLRVPATTLSLQQALVSLRSFYYSNAKKMKSEWDAKKQVVRILDEDSPTEWLEFGQKGNQVVVGFYSGD
jgi:hypothetical protein